MSDPVSRIKQYGLFFSIEVAAMALILWDGVPIYRHLMILERIGTRSDEVIMWTAVAAIQFTYWYLLRHEPPFTFQRRPLLRITIVRSSSSPRLTTSGREKRPWIRGPDPASWTAPEYT